MNGTATSIDLSPGAVRSALDLLEDPALDDSALDEAAARERYALAVWSHLVEPGDSVAGKAVALHGAAAALELLAAGAPIPGLGEQELAEARKRWMPRLDPRGIRDALRIAGTRGVRLVTRADPFWPTQLDDLEAHAPLCLWVRGDSALLARLQPSVALVGARAATRYGEHVAMELAADLAGGGIPIVSGGAYGIDGAAHRAALTVGGLTVALLAGGAERAYPAGHTRLIHDIARSGLVVSEVPCGAAPTKWRFLQRNRIIAAITDATVVVEAGWRSGALNTAAHAADLSRRLGAVPGPITSATSAGAHRVLREYPAQCITGAQDVREMLAIEPDALFTVPSDPAGGAGARPQTDDRARVRDALSTRTPRDGAEVARRAGMALDAVEALLGLLSLDGAVERTAAGWRLARTG